MKIIVALDSSSFANEVLEELTKRKWSSETEFRLVTVVESAGNWDVDQEYIHQAKIILNERVDTLKRKLPNTLRVSCELLEGDSASMILAEVQEWRADLVVLGSHGDTGNRREQLGSVAAAIVNQSPCSVEIVKIHSKNLQAK